MPTNIEWTDETWNPITGCTKVSAGCKHCYAEREWKRLAANPKTVYHGRPFTNVMVHVERMDQPMHWRRPRRVFVNSMSDLFHEDLPEDVIAEVFSTMAAVWAVDDRHQFQILTKRPLRMAELLTPASFVVDHACDLDPAVRAPWPLPRVWLGVSVESADYLWRIDVLRQVPAAIRFVSFEPLIGPIETDDLDLTDIDWVIVGGESGPRARPMHPAWVRAIRDQCEQAGVRFFFKQWGEWAPAKKDALDPTIIHITGIKPSTRTPEWHEFLDGMIMGRIGKKAAGREFDGITWDQYPVDQIVCA